MASVSYTSMVRKGRGGRNCKGGVVDAKIVKMEDKEGEWMGVEKKGEWKEETQLAAPTQIT